MNILILTGRFGMGHIKCAEALREKIAETSPYAQIDTVDLIEYLYPHSARCIYSAFGKLVTGCSGLYNQLNIIAGQKNCTPFKKAFQNKMKALAERYEPDLVIANLPICAQYFGAYKEQNHDKTPMYVFVTDITFHNEWIAPAADLYFVGDASTKNALISHGVDRGIIHITGIPVSDRFKKIKTAGKDSRVLVMGGGLGMVPGGKRTLQILSEMKDTRVTLVCGSNRKLKRYASGKYPNFNIVGRTDDVPGLMQKADVLITKPGGITTFEAIKSGTPLYIINPTLEQEKGNAHFIEGNNIGRVMYDQSSFTSRNLEDFLADKALLSTMRGNMKKLTESMEEQSPIHYLEAL